MDDDEFERLIRETAEQPPPSPLDPLRRFVTVRNGVIVLVLLIVVFGGRQLAHMFDPPGSPTSEVVLQVPEGATTTDITNQLAEADVVPSAWALRAWIRKEGATNLQAGEYTFHKNSSAGQALAVLRSGPDARVDRITIPEGYRVDQIAEVVGRLPGMSSEKFREVVDSGRIRSQYQPSGTKSLEGFMFPDTYLIDASDNEETIVRRMVSQFDTVARLTGLDQSSRAIAKNPFETLVIASMIESEARVPQDRRKISQVIQNRLFEGMPLQIDATVLYAIGNTKRTLNNNDLAIDNPYNTYKNRGLPPGPISNPGRASIEAALNPEQGPWLYYSLAASDGSHAFATTLEEHNANVAKAKAQGLF